MTRQNPNPLTIAVVKTMVTIVAMFPVAVAAGYAAMKRHMRRNP